MDNGLFSNSTYSSTASILISSRSSSTAVSPFCRSPRKRTAWSGSTLRHANSPRRHTCNAGYHNVPTTHARILVIPVDAIPGHVRIPAILVYTMCQHMSGCLQYQFILHSLCLQHMSEYFQIMQCQF